MNVQDIVTEYGSYYLNNGQNMASLYQLARRPYKSESAFTPMMTDDTIWRAGKSTFDRVVQPFQKKFTPISGVVFSPEEIRQYHLKADTQEYPDDLEATWLGFLASASLNRSEWPFIRWFLEKHYFPQIEQDMELNEAAIGVYAAPVDGVAGLNGTSMDGFLTIIKKFITANRITPIVMGAIPADDADFVSYVEDFCDQIAKAYWNMPMQINMNETLERRYFRGKREKYGKNFVGNDLSGKVDYTNLTVNGLPSHGASNRIWCTPTGNGVVLKKKTQNMKLVDLQVVDRLVKMLTDWWTGYGFILPEIVFCNDLL